MHTVSLTPGCLFANALHSHLRWVISHLLVLQNPFHFLNLNFCSNLWTMSTLCINQKVCQTRHKICMSLDAMTPLSSPAFLLPQRKESSCVVCLCLGFGSMNCFSEVACSICLVLEFFFKWHKGLNSKEDSGDRDTLKTRWKSGKMGYGCKG